MNVRHVLHVFRKDGLEILRDRRTLFVNVVLPALLYPFIALFMVQVVQLTQAHQAPPPRIALIDLPQRVAELLAVSDEEADQGVSPSPPGAIPKRPQAQALASDVSQRTVITLRIAALELQALDRIEDHDRAPDHEQRAQLARERLLVLLRADDLAGVVIQVPRPGGGPVRWFATYDNAHVHGDRAQQAMDSAANRYRRELILARLSNAGLSEHDLSPLLIDTRPLAPPAETMRTRFAGIIPMILVVFAALGAFYPAIDLIAGERERGTLESLLSWPVRRRDLFLGKLLVTCTAAVVSVLLNLTSLGITMALVAPALAN